MINARDVHEPEDERLSEEDQEVDTENDDVESEEDDEEELDEEATTSVPVFQADARC